MKMIVISVHSSGQPRTKMMSCTTQKKTSGERWRPRIVSPMICAPPRRANTAAKMLEPTSSQPTIAAVRTVRKTDSRIIPNERRLCAAARMMPPSAPSAAPSDGVARPKKIAPRTKRMSDTIGTKPRKMSVTVSAPVSFSRCSFGSLGASDGRILAQMMMYAK